MANGNFPNSAPLSHPEVSNSVWNDLSSSLEGVAAQGEFELGKYNNLISLFKKLHVANQKIQAEKDVAASFQNILKEGYGINDDVAEKFNQQLRDHPALEGQFIELWNKNPGAIPLDAIGKNPNMAAQLVADAYNKALGGATVVLASQQAGATGQPKPPGKHTTSHTGEKPAEQGAATPSPDKQEAVGAQQPAGQQPAQPAQTPEQVVAAETAQVKSITPLLTAVFDHFSSKQSGSPDPNKPLGQLPDFGKLADDLFEDKKVKDALGGFLKAQDKDGATGPDGKPTAMKELIQMLLVLVKMYSIMQRHGGLKGLTDGSLMNDPAFKKALDNINKVMKQDDAPANGEAGTAPAKPNGPQLSKDIASDLSTTSTLGYFVNDKGAKEAVAVIGKDAVTYVAVPPSDKMPQGSFIITQTDADGTQKRFLKTFQETDPETGLTSMGFVRLNLSNDPKNMSVYRGEDGKQAPQTVYLRAGSQGTKGDADTVTKIVEGQDTSRLQEVAAAQDTKFIQQTKAWAQKENLPLPTVLLGGHSAAGATIYTDKSTFETAGMAPTRMLVVEAVGLGDGLAAAAKGNVARAEQLRTNTYVFDADPPTAFTSMSGGRGTLSNSVAAMESWTYNISSSGPGALAADPLAANHRLGVPAYVLHHAGIAAFEQSSDITTAAQLADSKQNQALTKQEQGFAKMGLKSFLAANPDPVDAQNIHFSAEPENASVTDPSPKMPLGKVNGNIRSLRADSLLPLNATKPAPPPEQDTDTKKKTQVLVAAAGTQKKPGSVPNPAGPPQ